MVRVFGLMTGCVRTAFFPRPVPAARFGRLHLFLLLAAPLAASPAIAQSEGLDGRAIRERQPEQAPEDRRQAPAPTAPHLPDTPPPAAEAEPATFVLAGIVVEGATVFAPERFGPLYEDLLAAPVTAAELQTVAARITALYQDAGYVLSRAVIPRQTAAGGVVRIQVIEGAVGEVEFEGTGRSELQGYAAPLLAEAPLTLATLERQLLLIDDLSGIRVSDSRVRPLDEAAGLYALSVELEEERIDGTAYLDNRGTPNAGRLQLWTAAGLNSALGQGERLQLALFTVPGRPRELVYLETSATLPLGTEGLTLFLLGSASRGEAGGSLRAVDSETESRSATATLSYPLLRSRAHTLRLGLSVDLENAGEQQFDTAVTDDRTRSLRLRADYVSAGFDGLTFAGIEVSRGLDVLDASDGDEGRRSRFDGRAVYTKLNAYATREQGLGENWGLLLAASGQVSADPLLSGEEFALGGARFGRAYDYYEVSGDHGVGLSAELRYGRELAESLLSAYQLYGFYDWGRVWNRNLPEGFADQRTRTLSSVGAGLRLTLLDHVRSSLEIARPLTFTPDTTGDRSARVFFSLSADF
jgi:hemolysin activation/secretion protein